MVDRASQRRPFPPGVFGMKSSPRSRPASKRNLRSDYSAADYAQGGQRHIQRINKAARLVCQMDFAFKLLAEGFDQARAETPLSGGLDHGALRPGPNQMQTRPPCLKRPRYGDQ